MVPTETCSQQGLWISGKKIQKYFLETLSTGAILFHYIYKKAEISTASIFKNSEQLAPKHRRRNSKIQARGKICIIDLYFV